VTFKSCVMLRNFFM